MARNPLTRADLDRSGCDTPDCGHDHSELFLVQTCHMQAGLTAKYVKARGTMELSCKVCDRPVAILQIA